MAVLVPASGVVPQGKSILIPGVGLVTTTIAGLPIPVAMRYYRSRRT